MCKIPFVLVSCSPPFPYVHPATDCWPRAATEHPNAEAKISAQSAPRHVWKASSAVLGGQQGGKQHEEVSLVLSDNADGLCGKLVAGGSFCTSHNRLQMVMTSVCCQHSLVRPLAQDTEFFKGNRGYLPLCIKCHEVTRGCIFAAGA